MAKGDSSNRISIAFEPTSCIRDRSRWATCTLCMDTCPSTAITLRTEGASSLPSIDEARCLHCGQCLSACPLEAYTSPHFTESRLVARVPEEGVLRLRCFLPYGQLEALDASVRTYQLGTCLAALSPGVLFELALNRPLELAVERCAECFIYQRAAYTFRANVQGACQLLRSWNREANLRETVPLLLGGASDDGTDDASGAPCAERDAACPGGGAASAEANAVGSAGSAEAGGVCAERAAEGNAVASGEARARRMRTRMRSLFQGTRKNADADKTALALRERAKRVPSWRVRLGRLWKDCELDARPADDGGAWPVLIVDSQRCRACGICRQLCPTGAILHTFDGERFGYRFEPGICVDCGLCIASCKQGALSRDYLPSDTPFSLDGKFSVDAVPCSGCGMPVPKRQGMPARNGDTLCLMCKARLGKKRVAERIKTQMRAFFSKGR